MKSLDNKSITAGDKEIKYSELLKTCLNVVPKEGFTPSEMRTRLRILDILEKANGTIELEDADSQLTKKLVADMRWIVLSKDIVAFTEEVEKNL